MTDNDEKTCASCGGNIKYYDKVPRIVRSNDGVATWVYIERFRCCRCGEIHRKLPSNLLPYKQYDAKIIKGVLEGFITCETIGYEDYPCEMTMIRWKASRNLQLLL